MEEKIIDINVALDRLGGDREFLFELLQELLEQNKDYLPKIEEAINASDFENVRTLSHAMKGASANLGADRFAKYFKTLEEMGSNKNLTEAKELINKIRVTHIELSEYLENE